MGQGQKIARGVHRVGGKGRVVSRERSHSRCGYRDTVFIYRGRPLGGERGC